MKTKRKTSQKNLKVVINAGFGGFGLSDEAVEALIAKGFTVSKNWEDNPHFIESKDSFGGNNYYCNKNYDKRFRCNKKVVEVVEKLGEKVNGFCAKLKVIEIPFETTKGWEISEYDGFESIEECHRTWN